MFATSSFMAFAPCHGLDLMPWYPNDLQPIGRLNYLYQQYQRVASSHGSFRRIANDQFASLDLSLAYDKWDLEGELTLADTKHRSFGIDNFSLMLRYQLLNDVSLEDPVSLVISTALTTATNAALRDIGSFHHGKFAGQCFVSLGKEFDCGASWLWRFWGVAGIGIADIGSPWLSGSLHLQWNCFGGHMWGLFLQSLYGLGGNVISAHKQFRGYGPIKHRSIDIGVLYSYLFESEAKVTFSYARRAYARNFPLNANLVMLRFEYPFSL